MLPELCSSQLRQDSQLSISMQIPASLSSKVSHGGTGYPVNTLRCAFEMSTQKDLNPPFLQGSGILSDFVHKLSHFSKVNHVSQLEDYIDNTDIAEAGLSALHSCRRLPLSKSEEDYKKDLTNKSLLCYIVLIRIFLHVCLSADVCLRVYVVVIVCYFVTNCFSWFYYMSCSGQLREFACPNKPLICFIARPRKIRVLD